MRESAGHRSVAEYVRATCEGMEVGEVRYLSREVMGSSYGASSIKQSLKMRWLYKLTAMAGKYRVERLPPRK